ncbi:MAG: patatin-like phospholipase family protein [Lachnospiraceae bacterium]
MKKSKLRLDTTIEYGLVLEGGGAKGSYQIGAWKALQEAGVRFKAIAGTSVGALNGALICAGDLPQAEEIWRRISYSKVMEVDDDTMYRVLHGQATWDEKRDVLREFTTQHGFEVEPLLQLIRENITPASLRSSLCDLYIHTYNATQHMAEEIDIKALPDEWIAEYLLASAYLYPLFKQRKINGNYYLDGSVVDNLPLTSLLRRDVKDIIVIRIFGIGHTKAVDIPEDTQVHTIAPRVSLGKTIEFEPKRAAVNMKIGYFDTMRFLYGLQGSIYYIKNADKEEKQYDKKLRALCEAAGLLDADTVARQEILYQKFLKKTVRLLALRTTNRQEIYLHCLEAAARLCRVKKYKIYSPGQLLKEIQSRKAQLSAKECELPFMQIF